MAVTSAQGSAAAFQFVLSPPPLTDAEIAGIVVGTVVGVALIALGVVYWYKIKRARQESQEPRGLVPPEDPSNNVD